MPTRAQLSELRKPLIVALIAEILAVMYVSTIDPHNHIDVEVYQLGARAWLEGSPIYEGLPRTESGLPLPFIYPPFAAVVFAPLGMLPKAAATIIVMLISHLALFVTLYVVVRSSSYLAPHQQNVFMVSAVLLPLATVSEPVMETLTYTQINLILMVLVVLDCLWRTGREEKLPWPRGLMIGIAAGIKLTPAAFLLFFLLRRDFRSILISVVTFLATAAIGYLAAFADSNRFWFTEMFASGNVSFGSNYPGDASLYAGNQSLRSILAKTGLSGTGLTVVFAIAAVLVLAMAVLGMLEALREGNHTLALMVNAIASLLVSPISWSHHWVWAIPLLVLLIAMAVVKQHWALLISGLFAACLVMSGPMWKVPQGPGPQDKILEETWSVFEQLIGSAYGYLGLGFLLYSAFAWWQAKRSRVGTALTPVVDQTS